MFYVKQIQLIAYLKPRLASLRVWNCYHWSREWSLKAPHTQSFGLEDTDTLDTANMSSTTKGREGAEQA